MFFPGQEERSAVIDTVIFEVIKLEGEPAVLIGRIVDPGLSGVYHIFLPLQDI